MQLENISLKDNGMPQRGRFIVVEGLEGAGKTSALHAIVEWTKQRGITQLVQTREPGGTPLAEKMRDLVKNVHSEEVLSAKAELLLMYASRVQLVSSKIEPALAAGKWVLGDRHDLSSQAYQGGGRGIDAQLIQSIKQAVLGDFRPDFTLYLDIDPEVGLARARGRGELDRIEREALSFFQKTRERYLELAAKDSAIVTIDAGQQMQKVAADITEALDLWFATHKPGSAELRA